MKSLIGDVVWFLGLTAALEYLPGFLRAYHEFLVFSALLVLCGLFLKIAHKKINDEPDGSIFDAGTSIATHTARVVRPYSLNYG